MPRGNQLPGGKGPRAPLKFVVEQGPFVDGVAEATDAPPFARPWLATALAAWSVEAILVFGPGIPVPTSVAADQVPINRAHVQVAVAQWEVPDTPVPRRQYAPQGTVVQPDQPAYTRPWLETARAAWEVADQPAIRKLAPQAAPAVEGQVPNSRQWLNAALASWDLPPIIVWQEGAASVDGPVIAHSPPFVRRSVQWEEETWVPQRRVFAPQAEPAAVVVQPFSRPWLQAVALWAPEPEQVQPRRLLPPEAAPAAADSPPYKRTWLQTAVSAWDIPPILVLLQGTVAQGGAVVADSPPFTRNWLPAAIASWEPALDHPLAQRKYPQAEVAPVSDSPPYSRKWLQTAVSAWDINLIPLWGAVGIPVDPPAHPHIDREQRFAAVASWDPEVPRSPAQRTYPQEPPFVPGDQPVGGTRPWLKAALQAWEPLPPEVRQQPKRQVIDGPAPVPDAHPGGKSKKPRKKAKKYEVNPVYLRDKLEIEKERQFLVDVQSRIDELAGIVEIVPETRKQEKRQQTAEIGLLANIDALSLAYSVELKSVKDAQDLIALREKDLRNEEALAIILIAANL